MARILILIGGHLWANPRPQKEADTLANAGHEVTIAGIWFNSASAERDILLMSEKAWRFEPLLDFRSISPGGQVKNVLVRLRSRIARESYSIWGRCSPALLGYGAKEMLRAATRIEADLTIVRSEAGLWVGKCLLDRAKRVGVDFEDWYSEDMLPEMRNLRPIAWLKNLERRLARDCVYSITTSKVMADAIAAEYDATTPGVVYNVFPLADSASVDREYKDRKNRNIPSVHWFSQTIGPGRGLELLFLAAQSVALPFEIHLRGTLLGAYAEWLKSIVTPRLRERVFIHDAVPNDALLSRISEHDIGLALETSAIRSRDLTITNKLFQYLQSGLAVIATDTAGQKEVFAQTPNIGILISDNDATGLAHALTELLSNSRHLRDAKEAALAAFKEKFCWEHQSETVVRLVDSALAG